MENEINGTMEEGGMNKKIIRNIENFGNCAVNNLEFFDRQSLRANDIINRIVQKVQGDNIHNSNLSISLGFNTSTTDDFFNFLSPEKIGAFSFNASAIYGTSFIWLCDFALASGSRSEKSEYGMNVISSNRNCLKYSNSSFESLVSFINSSSCFSNSIKRNSGATNSNLLERLLRKNTFEGTPLNNNEETTTLTSTITFIFYNDSYLFASDSLILSEISSAFSSVNCDFANIFFNFLNLFNFSLNSLLIRIDFSMSVIPLISFANSSGSLIIISSMDINIEIVYKKLSILEKTEENEINGETEEKAIREIVKRKIYKYLELIYYSSLQTVSMIPGNREAAGCFTYSNNFGGFLKWKTL